MSKHVWLYSFLLFFSCARLLAQSEQLNSLILNVFDDPMAAAHERSQKFLQSAKFRTPWIREVDFRVRASRFDQVIESYRVRLDLANPRFRSVEKQHHQAFMNYQQVRSQIKLNELLHDRYLQLAGWYYTYDLYLTTQENLEKKIKLRNSLSVLNDETQDIREALSLDKDIYELSLELKQLKEELSVLALSIAGEVVLDSTTFQDHVMISVEEMYDQVAEGVLLKGISFEELLAEKEYLSKNYDLEKISQRRELGFIQPEFDPDPDNTVAENLSVQIGLLLPIVNPDKAEINYEKWEKELDQASVDNEITELAQTLQSFLVNAASLKEQHEMIAEKERALTLTNLSYAADDWKLINDVIDYRFDVMTDKRKVWMEMTEIYLQVLMISGKLAEPPVSNYLFSGTPSIDTQ